MSESQQIRQPDTYDDEIDLVELFRVLWKGKWLIGAMAFSATIIAVLVALMMPNIYRAEALLAPNNQESGSGLSALASQYSGLAGLAGFNLGNQSGNKVAFALEVLQSRKFVAEFVDRHNILVSLMAAEGWDARSSELKIDNSLYDENSKKWVRKTALRKQPKPSMQEAYDNFMKLLSVSEDSKTGFIILAMEHYSPDVAKQWVDWLVEDINSTMMTTDVAEAEQAIDYLNEQIGSTSIADLQSVFFGLIEEQTKTVMLARVSSEYMFRTVDPAVAPERKTKPKRAVVAMLGLLLGGIFGVAVVLFRSKS